MLNRIHVLIPAVLLALLATNANAQEAKPACEIMNPPANCSGMWYVSSEQLAPNTGIPVDTANPACQADTNLNAVDEILKQTPALISGDYRYAAGDLIKFINQTGVYNRLVSSTSGVVHDIIIRNGPKGHNSNCVLLAAYVPPKATIVGIRLHNHDIDAAASDPNVYGVCQPNLDCSNGFSKFIGYPDTREENGARAVAGVFANWSHNRRRVGKLTVFFTMPEGQKILPLM